MQILIIEDDEITSGALSAGFAQKQESTTICSKGNEGLRELLEGEYDLAIIDIGLPEISGEEIIRTAKERGIKTPIIVLTGDTDKDLKKRLSEMGVTHFMEKPFSFKELYVHIESL